MAKILTEALLAEHAQCVGLTGINLKNCHRATQWVFFDTAGIKRETTRNVHEKRRVPYLGKNTD